MRVPTFSIEKSRLHLVAWTCLAGLGLAIFSLFFPFKIVLTHVVANVGSLVVLFYATAWLVDRYVESGRTWTAIFWGAATFLLVSGLRILVNFYLIRQFPGAQNDLVVVGPIFRVSALVLATSAFIQLLAVSYQLLTNRYRRELQTRLLLQEQQAAQLDFLKAQINPHFLFNALNNIYSLTVLRSPDAPTMLLKLSDLLRYSIYEGRKKEVSLASEVRHIQNFIELFQMRSEHPADIRFEFGGDLGSRAIEPMILIPIVENCFKHADFDTNPAAFARISLRAEAGRLFFQTQNTFNRGDGQKDETGGVGLENIARRLELRYGAAAHRFDFRPRADGIFEVVLEIENIAQPI